MQRLPGAMDAGHRAQQRRLGRFVEPVLVETCHRECIMQVRTGGVEIGAHILLFRIGAVARGGRRPLAHLLGDERERAAPLAHRDFGP